MAKKESKVSIFGLFAFFAIIIKAIDFILGYFFKGNLGILSFIADIIVSVVALVVAWGFAKKCSKFWKLLYLIILILLIVGFAFGGLSL